MEAILANDLYAASGDQLGSPNRNPVQGVHSHVSPGTHHGFGSPPQGGAGGGTVFMPSTSFGRVQSGPELSGYNQYDRQAQQRLPVSRSQSVQHREYPSMTRVTAEYPADPGQSRNHERLGFHPSYPADQHGRWSPHQVEYGGMKTPERRCLEFRVPSGGSGYSDWSTTPSSDQSTPGSYRMPMFDRTTPVDYQQPSTPGDYYAPTPSGYRPSTSGDYRLPLSQDTRGYPPDRSGSWSQHPRPGHHPVNTIDPGYSGGRQHETQPMYSVERPQQYGATASHYPPVSRPSEPLHLMRQSTKLLILSLLTSCLVVVASHGSTGSNAGGMTSRTPMARNASIHPSEFQSSSLTAGSPTQQITPNDAYLQGMVCHHFVVTG